MTKNVGIHLILVLCFY